MRAWITESVKAVAIALLAFTIAAPAASAATISASLKPGFQADLANTLKLQAGSGNPTFTRATTAYVQDFEGVLRPVLSGEARFQGARRVENLVSATSETPSTNTAVTVTASTLSNPLAGYASAALAVPTTASSLHRLNPGNTRTLPAGSTVWYVAVVKAAGYSKVAIREQVTDTTEVAFNLSSGTILYESYASATGGLAAITSKGNGWYQIAVRKTNTANTGPLMNLVILPDSYTTGATTGAWTGDGSSGVYVTGLQIEDQTGQSNQNLSEYVSKGVLAAPYHGAGVDGVKYFNTLNGNTVVSSAVVAATGAKVTSAQAAAAGGVTAGVVDATGPMGYLTEGARTNLALQSQTLSTSWTVTDATISADVATAPDGTLTADKLVEAATTAVHTAYQAPAVSGNVANTRSFYLKAGERTWAYVSKYDGTGGDNAFFDLANGAVGTVAGSATATITPVGNGWYRCSLTATTAAGATSDRIQVAAASGNGTVSYAGDITKGIYVWGAQLEVGSFASSYIPTTTGSATRNADVLSYATSVNVSGSVGTAYAEAAASYTAAAWPSATVVQSIILSGDPGVIMYGNTTSLRFYDATAERTLATFTPTTALSKVAAVWSGNVRGFLNGVSGTAQSFDGDIGLGANLYIGSFTGGLYPWFGTLRNVKVWKKALTTTQLTTITSSNTATARAAVPQTTVKTPTKTGLVGHWKLDEGAGTKANDSSGNGKTGTFNGSPSWIQGKLGKALSFNGSQSVNSISAASLPSGTAAVSIFAWIKTTSSTRETAVSYGGSASGQAVSLNVSQVGSNGHFIPDFYNMYVDSGVTVNDGRWHLVGFTLAGNTTSITMYVDGVAYSGTLSGTPSISAGTNAQIGRWVSAGAGDTLPYYFNGSVDDARVYDRVLSAAEVTALYKSTATVINASTNTSLTSGLAGLWSFDGKDMNWGTGIAYDRSGQGNNGSLTGMSTSTSPVMGKIGQGLRFDGVDDKISLGTSATFNLGAGNFSLCAWFKTTGTEEDIVANGVSANGNYLLMSYLGKVRGHIWYSGDANTIDSNATVNTGTWQHTCQVVDSTNIYLYINGSLDKSQALVGTKSGIAGSGVIGHRLPASTGASQFEGSIDDVRLYNRALSATEAKALYNLGR